ncbi:hypothetical protein NX722_22210 [Endozoicomonas gorgoniicola]|uniref:Tryptophan synthase subunit beta like protein n=1 Tax=Endozoicomonas gorgoniicola TaxID=1234144 RepID=A0ABT3N0Y6_9GAMM|nr:hypothetical protein [Endozoicomonas gorgoniicola]MCW7555291.1 hypothetical protein [Endozoicomonas gorgoniicola]
MLYALKDDKGLIIAVSEKQLSDEWKSVDLEDEAVLIFLQRNPTIGGKVMQAADADFIRVLEDVIDLLIDKAVIQFTELPDPVQNKLLNRRRYREELRKEDRTSLIGGEDDENIF